MFGFEEKQIKIGEITQYCTKCKKETNMKLFKNQNNEYYLGCSACYNSFAINQTDGIMLQNRIVAEEMLLSKQRIGSKCQYCDQVTIQPLVLVSFSKQTGMFIVNRVNTYKGHICRRCANKIYRDYMLHSFFLGWWGIASFFCNPITLIGDTIMYCRAMYKFKKIRFIGDD